MISCRVHLTSLHTKRSENAPRTNSVESTPVSGLGEKPSSRRSFLGRNSGGGRVGVLGRIRAIRLKMMVTETVLECLVW